MKIEQETPNEQPRRRQRISGCTYCDSVDDKGFPAHDASPRCESGKHNHCTCDVCW